jgi:hypothetical protein
VVDLGATEAGDVKRDKSKDPYRAQFDVFSAADRALWLDPTNVLPSAEHLADVMPILKELFGDRCAYCWRTGLELTRDHVVGLGGGESGLSNIAPACRACNSAKCNRGVLSLVDRLVRPYTPRFQTQCTRLHMTPTQWYRFQTALAAAGFVPLRYTGRRMRPCDRDRRPGRSIF